MKRIYVSRPKSVLVTSRHVAHRTVDHTGHVHSFLSLRRSSSPTSHTLLSELQTCADLRRSLSGALAESSSLAVRDTVDDDHSDGTEKHRASSEHRDELKFTEFPEHRDEPKNRKIIKYMVTGRIRKIGHEDRDGWTGP